MSISVFRFYNQHLFASRDIFFFFVSLTSSTKTNKQNIQCFGPYPNWVEIGMFWGISTSHLHIWLRLVSTSSASIYDAALRHELVKHLCSNGWLRHLFVIVCKGLLQLAMWYLKVAYFQDYVLLKPPCCSIWHRLQYFAPNYFSPTRQFFHIGNKRASGNQETEIKHISIPEPEHTLQPQLHSNVIYALFLLLSSIFNLYIYLQKPFLID